MLSSKDTSEERIKIPKYKSESTLYFQRKANVVEPLKKSPNFLSKLKTSIFSFSNKSPHVEEENESKDSIEEPLTPTTPLGIIEEGIEGEVLLNEVVALRLLKSWNCGMVGGHNEDRLLVVENIWDPTSHVHTTLSSLYPPKSKSSLPGKSPHDFHSSDPFSSHLSSHLSIHPGDRSWYP